MKISILLLALSLSAFADTAKDRERAVRDDRLAMEKDSRWIYNDFQKGFAEAKRQGKPLLVVLRCVPCLACAGIDASVLTQPELSPLLAKFVCVRVMNANALDLSLFQVDYDLSFSTVFFNGDGTVYGRYGSWRHQKDAADKDTAGFKRALEATLAIHHKYPANKLALAGKQGAPIPFNNPLDIPELSGKYQRELDWPGKVVQSCVHCHQVGDAMRSFYRNQKKTIPAEWVYPWPAPETIGLTFAPDQKARVQSVAPESIAAQAGLLDGDEFLSLSGQPLVSVADITWVLHNATDSVSIPAVIRRKGKEKALSIALPIGWRGKSDISRRVGTWQMRAMAMGGLLSEDLTDEERSERHIDNTGMALFVNYAGEYGMHAAAKKAGFQKSDIIVKLDGISRRMTESELIGYLIAKHQPGEKVDATVLRGGQRLELSLPMQ